jgi:hypothetical protein
MQYQPVENLVKTLGVPQAKQRLEGVLARSINPRIIDMDVTDEFLRYRYPLSYLMGNPQGSTTAERRVVFREVGRVDVFENHVVFIRGSDEKVLAQLVFTNAEDARTFADLVHSFRAYRSSLSK